MDGTQTSEPTEAGPGHPGQASAFLGAPDESAALEGPLDLTVPLNIAAIRAALAGNGTYATRSASPAAPSAAAAPPSASAADACPQQARRGSRHSGPRRLGRIAAFVAVAAAMSVGTACALVLSDNAQTTPVSLPASGAIPVAPSTDNPQPGKVTVNSGSTSAKAAPSLSRSVTTVDPVDDTNGTDPNTSPTVFITPTYTVTASSSASAHPSGDPSGDPTNTLPPPNAPTASYGANWELLYQGVGDSSQEEQETTDVQNLLDKIGYLAPWRHRTYVDAFISVETVGPDDLGFYGDATSDALAQFQVEYDVPYTDQLGSCDLATYQALMQIVG